MASEFARLLGYPRERGSSLIVVAGVVIVAIFFTTRLPFLAKEYAPEEAAWIRAGQGVAATGFPYLYMGDNNPNEWAYWKGPLFPVLLGSGFKMLAETEAVARSIPLLFSLGQIIFLYALARRLWPDSRGSNIALLAIAIIVINPFAIQNSVQVDIDGGLVGFFALAVLYFAWPASSGRPLSRADWIGLAVAGCLSFLTRFDTTIMLFAAIVVTSAFLANLRTALRLGSFFAGTIVAAIILIASYHAALGQLDKFPDPFFNMTSMTKNALLSKVGEGRVGNLAAPDRLGEVLNRGALGFLAPLIGAIFPTAAFVTVASVWVTLPFVALVALVLGIIFKHRRTVEPPLIYLLAPTILIIAAFSFVAPTFNYPRYLHTGLLLVSLVAAAVIVKNLAGKRLSPGLAALSFLLLLLVLELTPLGSVLFEDRVRSDPLAAGLGTMTAVLVGVAAAIISSEPERLRRALVVILLVYFASGATLVSKDLGKSHSLNAYYGNGGFRAAGLYLQKIVPDGAALATVDTVGYYYGRRYYDVNGYLVDWPGPVPDYVAVYRLPAGRFSSITEGMRRIASFDTVDIFAR